MALLLLFAFFSGFVTILAPCIWPILPLILSSSIGSQGRLKPAGIVLGIMVSFSVLTLSLSSLVRIFPIDPNILRTVAVIVITLLGLTLLIPKFSAILEGWVSRLSNRFGSAGSNGNGLGAGVLTGLTLGIVWAPCAGPILATITALSATGRVSGLVVALTLAYTAGVGVPLFILAYGGQRLLTRSRILTQYTGRIQQVFGVVMILTAMAIYTNYDQVLQVKVLEYFPRYSQVVSRLENSPLVSDELSKLTGTRRPTISSRTDLFNTSEPAPELSGITRWLNTDQPLTLEALRGKVVLIDFWTYTCINCIRTLPHVTRWYDTYKDKGFVVIGVHTPEFEFEKKTENVSAAIKRFGIHYPVAQDNDFITWQAFSNHYWPAEYLIDATGKIRRTHFGEGEYDQMETAIQELLKESGSEVSESIQSTTKEKQRSAISPETYLGSDRMEYYFPGKNLQNGTRVFTYSPSLPKNSFSLNGEWTIRNESAVAGTSAGLRYHFNANDVYLVMRPGASRGNVRIRLDGKDIDSSGSRGAGKDVQNGNIIVDTDRLYHLIHLPGSDSEHILELQFLGPNIEAFAFTFG